jgi:hypothetical protein
MPETFGKRQRKAVKERKAAAREERRVARNQRKEQRASGELGITWLADPPDYDEHLPPRSAGPESER